jgi:glucose/arabinose dehydrogenase
MSNQLRRRFAVVLMLVLTGARAEAQLRAVPYVGGLVTPVAFVQDPSDATVQYVVEQRGRIRVVKAGVLQPADFINLTDLVAAGGERGLLGLAFPPNYAVSGRFYVYYTRIGNGSGAESGDIVVARYTRSAANPLVADRSSRKDLFFGSLPYIEHSSASNHNGGHLAFGPDGYLYIAVGDGGDTPQLAQAPNSLLGKILRLDVNVSDLNPVGYLIPPSNPFVDARPVPALHEIWAFGLRNPWKFSFDDVNGGTNALVVGDVGQGAWEEIDYEPANSGGRNYGWPHREGAHDYFGGSPTYPATEPTFEYDHAAGNSITGGYVYRGSELRTLFKGRYFCADFIRGRVWSLGLSVSGMTGEATATDLVEHTSELGGSDYLGAISAFGRDAAGELYIVSYAGTIFRIVDVTPPPDVQVIPFNDNGDAYKDILLLNRTTGEWTIQRRTVAGDFAQHRSGGWAIGWQISVANFNGDGLDDLFLYNPVTGVWVKVINSASGFSYLGEVWMAGFTVHVVDFNADGRTDIFAYDAVSGRWYTGVSTGAGTAGFAFTGGGWRAGWQVYPADFDGDSRTDFLLYDPTGGVFVKAITRGDGIFVYFAGGWAPGWFPVVAELNGDTHDDVLLYHAASGTFVRSVSTGDGTGGFSYVAGGWAAGWNVRAADFDGNGLTDVFLFYAGGLWFKVINSGAAFSYFMGGWRLWDVTIADLNGDGRSDVFLYDRSTRVWCQALTTTPGAFTYTAGTFPP